MVVLAFGTLDVGFLLIGPFDSLDAVNAFAREQGLESYGAMSLQTPADYRESVNRIRRGAESVGWLPKGGE